MELPKVVVSTSKRHLIRRCAIHVLPVLTTIAILSINVHGIYIGQDFSGPIKSETINLLLLQVAAKIHEIMIVGSLGLIVFHAVRYELLFGDGLPLGFIGSGISFSNFQFFFNKEFYGAGRHWFNQKRSMRKAGFVALLVVSGTIAALAGPSSATLLIPKAQPWSGGGTELFLNGTTDDFWPVDLSSDLSELQGVCSVNNSASLAVCPAGGFTSLWEHWGHVNHTNYRKSNVRSYAKWLSGSAYYWPISSPGSQIPPRYAIGDTRQDERPRSSTYLIIPHAGTTFLTQQAMTDWWDVIAPDGGAQPSRIDDRQAYSTHLHAITTTRCSQPQNISRESMFVEFPSLQGRFDYAAPLNLTLSSLPTAPTDHLKFSWVHLPDEFGALSIGGLFESAWSNNDSRVVVACSVQAGWVPAEGTTDEYSFWTGWYPWNVTFGDRVPFFNAVPRGQPIGLTNGRIAMGNTWLNLLTPPTHIRRSISRNERPSTIESILESVGFDEDFTMDASQTMTETWTDVAENNSTRAALIEAIICSVIADGLSRHGSHRVFNDATNQRNLSLSTYKKKPDFAERILRGEEALVRPGLPPAQLSTLRVNMQITGFAFRQTLAGSLAMIVLITHVLMATVHTAWVLYTGETSGCWSLVTELLTLAYNSRTSAPCLTNTGAGISQGTTFGRVAKIVIGPQARDTSAEKVELVFEGLNDVADEEMLGVAHIDATEERHEDMLSIEPLKRTVPLRFLDGFDDRPHTTSRDTLISKGLGISYSRFKEVKVGRAYG